VWNDPERAQDLGRERAMLEKVVNGLDELGSGAEDARELLEMAEAEADEDTVNEVVADLQKLTETIEALEFQRMFSGPQDASNAFIDIQSGSGGTEAQDWAEMLLRMYLRWGDRRGFAVELMEVSAGEVAGIKSATIQIKGEYAFGWLRTETGVHRLVRKSPFDSGNRRHTSFSSVFIYPEVNEDIDVDINPTMGDWKCKECGYNVKSDAPPEKCPSCDKKCEFVDTTCYIPDCGNTGQDPRL